MLEVLVLYYSRYGAVTKMADFVARGIESVDGVLARLRTVPSVSSVSETVEDDIPKTGAPYASAKDFEQCHGLVLGSPTRFGNMAAPMKHFIDQQGAIWMSGQLVDKPAGVFSSTASLHGGQETTLISMMLPLMHLGCLIVGIPYTEKALLTTMSGGTPYGATHVAGEGNANYPITDHEQTLCMALGSRVARIAKQQVTH